MNKPTREEVQEKFNNLYRTSDTKILDTCLNTIEYFLDAYQPEITVKQALELLIEKGCAITKGTYYAPYGNGPVENCIHWFIERAELEPMPPKPEPVVTNNHIISSSFSDDSGFIEIKLYLDKKHSDYNTFSLPNERAKQIYDILKGED